MMFRNSAYYLHFTLILLKLLSETGITDLIDNLHFTLILLKLEILEELEEEKKKFTFHFDSIKTHPPGQT